MKPCPCCSGLEYGKCCQPYISGRAKAPTAQALMRSRYTAYAEHEIDYIINTCVRRGSEDIDPKSTREWSEQSEWFGLNIITTEKGGISDNEGVVEFEALYERGDLKETHHERARFKKQHGEWLYEDGTLASATVKRSTSKTGRNDPCPCGSGKKYKHCCLGKNGA